MAVLGHPFEDTVGIIKRGGQQVGGLVRGVTEHDALIAGAFVLVAALVDALRDVRRLRVEVVLELGGLPVEAGLLVTDPLDGFARGLLDAIAAFLRQHRSEEHTSELQSLMRISYAVFCLKKKIK